MYGDKLKFKTKLTLHTTLTALISLTLGGSAIVLFDSYDTKSEVEQFAQIQAAQIAKSITAAVAFEDLEVMKESLVVLEAVPNITHAMILSVDGELWASFSRYGDQVEVAKDLPTKPHSRFVNDHLEVYHAVMLDKQLAATVFIRRDLNDLVERHNRFIIILFAVFVVSLLLGTLMTVGFQRVFTRPVNELLWAANEVSRTKDYSIRAKRLTSDELGSLTVAFNEMITEVQLRDKAVRESEDRFRQLTTHINEVFWLINTKTGQVEFVSPAYEALWKRSINDLYDDPTDRFQAIHPEDRERVIAAFSERAALGEYDEDYRLVDAEGHICWVRDRGFPILDQFGNIHRIAGVADDITDRKVARSLLQGRTLVLERLAVGSPMEEVLSLLVEVTQEAHAGVMCAVLVHDEPTRSLRVAAAPDFPVAMDTAVDGTPVDGAVVELFGLTPDDVEGPMRLYRVYDHDYDDDRPIALRDAGIQAVWSHSIHTGDGQSLGEFIMCTRDARDPDDLETAMLITGAKLAGVVIDQKVAEERLREINRELRHEISERQRAEEQVTARNADLEVLLFVTSHDLREPLRAMQNFSKLISARYRDKLDDKGQDFLDRIVRGANRMDRLIEDVLILSRAQRMTQPSEWVPAGELVGAAIEQLVAKIHMTNTSLKVSDQLPAIFVDRKWMTQAFFNLISNAIKFAKKGESPQIEVVECESALLRESEIGIKVRDRGIGISHENADRIFQLFKRDVGREVEGTGAGLAIVRQIVERHNGRIWSQPREGGGTDFILAFPSRAVTGADGEEIKSPAMAAAMSSGLSGLDHRIGTDNDKPGGSSPVP